MELEFVGSNNLSDSISNNQINNKNAMMNEETTNTPIFVSIMNSASHPTICIFHMLFKLLSFLSFIFGPFFFSIFSKNSFILSFFLTTILFSLDFWTVKNITGRILIGMRWWYEVSKNGETIWMFENSNEPKNNHTSSSTDKSIFWITTYLWTLLWIIIFFLQLFSLKLQWISLSIIAIVLSSSNLIGYTKCLRSSNSLQKDWIANLAVKTIIDSTQNIV